MKKKTMNAGKSAFWMAWAIASVMLMPAMAFAQNGEVQSRLTVQKVIVSDSGEELEAVSSVKPGDTVEYRLVYTNERTDQISNLKPVLPIPMGMNYLAETASPSLYAASLVYEGGFESAPLMRRITLENGENIEELVDRSQYKQLQWLISDLDPGETVEISVRMRVADTNTAIRPVLGNK